MAKEICISSTPHETRLAILEDDQLAEIYYERENEYTLAGSVYNGRVTRVLPGMQSAFVDVGLERDAFLYVTDFLELEDPEETDELEKAAASSGNQPPREVRHPNGQEQNGRSERNGGRGEDRGPHPGQKPEQKLESRPERQPRDRRFAIEAIPESGEAASAAPESPAVSEQAEGSQEDSGAPGARRWRGRRRRRGGRGPAGSPESQTQSGETEETAETYTEAPSNTEFAPQIHAAALVQTTAPRTSPTAVPFVLPGESLSKYGVASGSDDPKAAATSSSSPAAAARPASTYKPSSLIEAPITWDGSGLLPGESLSKHRGCRVVLELIYRGSIGGPTIRFQDHFDAGLGGAFSRSAAMLRE